MIKAEERNQRMIQQEVVLFKIIIILLLWPTNASEQPQALTTNSNCSIFIRSPFAVGVIRFMDKRFEKDPIFDVCLKKNIDVELEVHELPMQNFTGYMVKYCKTEASSGRKQNCKYILSVGQNWTAFTEKILEEVKNFGRILRLTLFTYNCSASLGNTTIPLKIESQEESLFGKGEERRRRLSLKLTKKARLRKSAGFRKSADEEEFGALHSGPSFSFSFNTLCSLLLAIWIILPSITVSVFICDYGTRWLRNTIKKRKDIKIKMEFFKRNGGLLLQKQLSSSDGSVHQCQIFNSKELNVATNNFDVNRILGHGGQGTVYKGLLEDGRIVAIKKSKVAIVDEEKIEEFVNEVAVLSQINHRNVVKLLGCCLETEIPILVYEFISNGTLFEYLHDHYEDLPLTWDMRLRIAAEVAGALSYLHFGASSPVIHRDIKSKNILLDNKFRAKVADFGTSKSISITRTHITTKVQGTLGYLDPEYHQSSQLTDKSDVYSFGVVLVELLTGLTPIFSIASQEHIILKDFFVLYMKKRRLSDILDAQVVMQYGKKDQEIILAFAVLAKSCLNGNGRERPTMKEVSTTLEAIRARIKKESTFRKTIKRLIQ